MGLCVLQGLTQETAFTVAKLEINPMHEWDQRHWLCVRPLSSGMLNSGHHMKSAQLSLELSPGAHPAYGTEDRPVTASHINHISLPEKGGKMKHLSRFGFEQHSS